MPFIKTQSAGISIYIEIVNSTKVKHITKAYVNSGIIGTTENDRLKGIKRWDLETQTVAKIPNDVMSHHILLIEDAK